MLLTNFYPNCTVTSLNVLFSYTNKEDAVRAEVVSVKNAAGKYAVRIVDTDANLALPLVDFFNDENLAVTYAKTC